MTYLYAAARAPRQNRLAALVLSLSCLLVGLPSGIGLLLLTPILVESARWRSPARSGPRLRLPRGLAAGL
jgi:hypothetical protein